MFLLISICILEHFDMFLWRYFYTISRSDCFNLSDCHLLAYCNGHNCTACFLWLKTTNIALYSSNIIQRNSTNWASVYVDLNNTRILLYSLLYFALLCFDVLHSFHFLSTIFYIYIFSCPASVLVTNGQEGLVLNASPSGLTEGN